MVRRPNDTYVSPKDLKSHKVNGRAVTANCSILVHSLHGDDLETHSESGHPMSMSR